MIFELEPSCFHPNPRSLDLLAIGDLVLKGRHRIYVRENSQAEYLEWLQSLTVDLLEGWNSSLDLSVKLEALEPANCAVTVCNDIAPVLNGQSLAMNVEQARLLAGQPFRVFLENDEADRNFLITYSNKEQKKKIEELESRSLIRFEHCGGIGEMPKKVTRFVKRTPINSLISSAVFDCDASQPNQPSGQSQNVVDVCRGGGVPAHRLKRRAIENYILRSWLNSWVNQSKQTKAAHLKRFNAVCGFNDAQRHYFHMKGGLKKDKKEISNGSNTLYAALSPKLLGELDNGFGAAVSEIFSWPWVQESEAMEDFDGWSEVNGIVRSLLVLFR